MVARSTVSLSSFESLSRNGRASATKSVRAEAGEPQDGRAEADAALVGDAAISSFSAASAATMRCTVERASPPLRDLTEAQARRLSSSARRIAAARRDDLT